MEDCIFCKITKGEIPCFKIYEDNDVLSFLDIKPFSKGHCLVIPKQHFENVFDISEDALQKVSVVAKKLSEKIKDVFSADGIRLSQSNGVAAGQEVMHFHLHIIPRYENDGLGTNPTATAHLPQADFEELKKVAEKLQ
ncbi:MAG: HIT family protein [Candidatus Staskawiczbacteria bacterium]|nr:HIT family protein [Candidatus Staskawiczbacteria bacterium]